MANTYLKLEFWNSCDTDILYEDGFKQNLFIYGDLVVSTPSVEEEGSENRDNEFTGEFQKFKNRYLVEFMATEYLIDALSGLQLCDNVRIVRKTGESANINNISLGIDWKFKDCYALVGLSFSVDYVAKNPCCEEFPCGECTPEISSYVWDGLDIVLKGVPCGDGFIQVQEFVGGVWVDLGLPKVAGKFDSTGIRVTPTTSPTVLRVWAYDHLCDYGYSESIESCGGLVCEISPATEIKAFVIRGTAGKVISIDWGDGSSENHVLTGGLDAPSHSYTAGNYNMALRGDVDEVDFLRIVLFDVDSYYGIECFENIVTWRMDYNNISSLNAGEIDGLLLLESIDFDNNNLATIPSGYFDNNVNMDFIVFDNNSISSLPSGLFDSMLTIQQISFSTNLLSSLPSGLLDNNTNLTQVNFGNNSLSSLPANFLQNNIILRNVSFNNNALDVSSVDYIFNEVNGYGTTGPPPVSWTVSTIAGTNASPTGGAANADIVALTSRNWTCFYN